MKIGITVTENEVIMSTPTGVNSYSNSLVITKEAFIECYEKWIKPMERKVDDLDFISDENLKRQVRGLKGIAESQTIVINDLVKRLNELHDRVYALEKWRKS